LEKHINGGKAEAGNGKAVQDYGLVKNIAGQCPDCGNLLVYQEGCFICPGCGYTKC
jgi:ribonucleoside-diphosphate reductase alpha chain